MTSRVCRCDGIVPGIVHPDCPIHAPTRDAEQAVEYLCTCSANERSGVAPPSPFCPLHGTHPVTPTARETVREALDHLAKWPQSMNRDEFLADVEVLLTAVRQAENRIATLAERARIRGIVEGQLQVIMRDVARWGWNTEKRSSSSAYESVLAALDGTE